ncbi:MAG: hypothetical protein NTX52_12585, partial [Planctomycetota bacterium]|nr:hypothetical protein [Planctomycetota bacterium]
MRNFSKAKRIVVKIGTNTLTKNGGIDAAYVRQIAAQISSVLKTGRQVVIVTSGAIGMGAGQLSGYQGIRPSGIRERQSGLAGRIKETKMRQACAAIGQPLLMAEYRKSFLRYGVTVAQVLLTADVLNNRKTYLNLRNSIET